jgi:hypothetical protein
MSSRFLHRGAIFVASVSFLMLFSRCGTNAPTVISYPPISPANITGNWELTANFTSLGTSPISLGPASFAIYMTSNAGSVSGFAIGPPANDLLVYPDGCVGGPFGRFDVALTGQVDANGKLTLSSPASTIPAFTMSGSVSGSTISGGSFTLACSSSGSTAQGTITGIEYPPLNGTFAGTLTSQLTGQSFTLSATLNQSGAPNSNGLLSLAGTVNVGGYSYIPSAAMPIPSDFTFVGNDFGVYPTASGGEALYLTVALSSDGRTLGVTYGTFPSGGGLTQDYGTGTLTLQ